MDVSRPHAALSHSRDLDILKALAGTTHPLTGRGVARLVEAPHSSVQPILDRLVAEGSVERFSAGRALMYSLNREHLVTPAVELIAGLRTELLRRLRESVESWHVQPVHVSLFGSAARGDGDPESDIDLLVVRPREVEEDDDRWVGQLDDLAASVRAWTGNRAAIVELPDAELSVAGRTNAPLLANIGREAIDVTGRPATELLHPRG